MQYTREIRTGYLCPKKNKYIENSNSFIVPFSKANNFVKSNRMLWSQFTLKEI